MKPADRKKLLIAQGRVHRAEAMLAKDAVRAALQPESLVRNALAQVGTIALSSFKNERGSVSGAALSLVQSGASALAKQAPSLKPALRNALLAGVAAGLITLLTKRKPAPAVEDSDRSG